MTGEDYQARLMELEAENRQLKEFIREHLKELLKENEAVKNELRERGLIK